MTDKQASPNAAPPAERCCPPFHPATLQFQMNMDAAWRLGSVAMMAAALIFAAHSSAASHLAYLLALFVVVGWIAISISSARVWQVLARVTALLEHAPQHAETLIADALSRRALHRAVRLLMYHRLAVLRHRQQRFAEAAAICQALLAYNLGAVRQVRPHLLLLLAECRLLACDLYGAWLALGELAPMELNLIESAQRMALRTRYEIAAGYYQLACQDVRQKVQLSELMPPAQCGALHAMLAFAARHCDHGQLADWLQQRAELLCTPQQIQSLSTPAEQ
jgi:hypothetical protein